MTGTYLQVTFRERDAVKALGARFDWERKQWFVPAGRDLSLFRAWLPDGMSAPSADRELVPASNPGTLDLLATGITLSRLLAGVAAAVAQAYAAGVWTTAEVLQAREVRGHWYLELAERLPSGEVVAKSNAVIWARNAARLIAAFQQETGASLNAGIKVLLRAKPSFTAEHGFILVVDGIDASYTLGDLEARKREIRARLQLEGLFARNKALPAPWDYARILVVAPLGAGLGDFVAEAERLVRHGALQAVYAHCRFQGEGSAAEVRQTLADALRNWPGPTQPDAVVIIRGGGAVNDLAWLNDYTLARFICECPVPVLTGIGHERDSTVLDEVAHQKFDTPSKVIAGIEQLLIRRARESSASYEAIMARAARDLERAAEAVARLHEQTGALARSTLADARARTNALMATSQLEAAQSVHRASAAVQESFAGIRTRAFEGLGTVRHGAPTLMAEIRTGALQGVARAAASVEVLLPAVLDRAAIDVSRTRQSATTGIMSIAERARSALATAAEQSEALVREVAGQGPEKTIARGFAIVSTAAGQTISSVEQLADHSRVTVRFRDGIAHARVDPSEVFQADAPQADAPQE